MVGSSWEWKGQKAPLSGAGVELFFAIDPWQILFVRARDEFCLCLDLKSIMNHLMSVDGGLLMMSMLI